MLVTVKGTYQNGLVHLSEPVPAATEAGQVLVTFLPASGLPPQPAPARPRFSFDEALARTADTSHVQVSDAVLEEREENEW